MRDIVVTTPKSEMGTAALEAKKCLEQGGGVYFRSLATMPSDFGPGSKIFYVENGCVRGFGVVFEVQKGSMRCSTTGRVYAGKHVALMRADSWKWIATIPMKGFQGWRYFNSPYTVVGSWCMPKPFL